MTRLFVTHRVAHQAPLSRTPNTRFSNQNTWGYYPPGPLSRPRIPHLYISWVSAQEATCWENYSRWLNDNTPRQAASFLEKNHSQDWHNTETSTFFPVEGSQDWTEHQRPGHIKTHLSTLGGQTSCKESGRGSRPDLISATSSMRKATTLWYSGLRIPWPWSTHDKLTHLKDLMGKEWREGLIRWRVDSTTDSMNMSLGKFLGVKWRV